MTRAGLSLAAASAMACLAFRPSARAESTAADGYLDRSEVCDAGTELSSQDDMTRPYGGVVHLEASTTPAQRALLAEGSRYRLDHSQGKAIWRLVYGAYDASPLAMGEDGVMAAACPVPPLPTNPAWAYRHPTGGLVLVWSDLLAMPHQDAVEMVAAALRDLEGDAD